MTVTTELPMPGTLTFGVPTVRDVVPLDGASAASILETAPIAEVCSEHPLGRAIVAHARYLGASVREPDEFESVPGRGVSASLDGNGIRRLALVPRGGENPCCLTVTDRRRHRI
jgi:Cd2+/Zn2+-exporting ATPase/Cu+-exporting ATPase